LAFRNEEMEGKLEKQGREGKTRWEGKFLPLERWDAKVRV